MINSIEYINENVLLEEKYKEERKEQLLQYKKKFSIDYDISNELSVRYKKNKRKFIDNFNKKTIFVDKGNELQLKSNDYQYNSVIIHDMLQIAQIKGWGNIKIQGTEQFKQSVWLQSQKMGIQTFGYKPNQIDIANIEKYHKTQKEYQQHKEEQVVNNNKSLTLQEAIEALQKKVTNEMNAVENLSLMQKALQEVKHGNNINTKFIDVLKEIQEQNKNQQTIYKKLKI